MLKDLFKKKRIEKARQKTCLKRRIKAIKLFFLLNFNNVNMSRQFSLAKSGDNILEGRRRKLFPNIIRKNFLCLLFSNCLISHRFGIH